MSAPSIIQTNFTAGELSPEAYGRVDIAKYNNAAKTLKNVIVQVLGGAKGRGGLRYVASTKDSTRLTRIIPFVFSRSQSYILEFGHQCMRVYKNGAQVQSGGSPYEIVTPYTESMLAGLDYVQGQSTMFISHQSVPINRLICRGDTSWTMDEAPFIHVPTSEIGHIPSGNLTLSAATVGTGRTATASSASFLPADVGRSILMGAGVGVIQSVTSSTVAVINITHAFGGTSFAGPGWIISGTPVAPITPSLAGPVGGLTQLRMGESGTAGAGKAITSLWFFAPRLGNAAHIAGYSAAHGYAAGQTVAISGAVPVAFNGTYTISAVSADSFAMEADLGIATQEASVPGTVTKSASTGVGGWRSADVGSYVYLNGGIVRIDTVVTSEIATGEICKEMTAAIQAQVDEWTLQQPAWNTISGYPSTITLHSQRLFAAGSSGFPQTIWASEIGNTLNFLGDIDDDDGFSYSMESREVNPIAYLPSNRALMAMTYGGEFTIFGGQEKPITPTNIQINPQSTFGCALVRPILIGNQLFYIQRDGRVLRAASYQLEADAYISPDISKLSKHLMTSPIISMAYQQSPYSCIWMVRGDGKAISVTIDNEENVIAWSWHETDGLIESIACIPGSDGQDQLWAVVKRTINSVVKRYVERMDDTVHTDACLTGTSGTATTAWSGLTHLEGKTVKVVADGVPITDCVVASGAITIEVEANDVEIGLPYTPTVSMLTPELTGPLGTSQGKAMRISKATVHLLETVGCHINGDPVEFRRLDTTLTLDSPVAPFTGTHELTVMGWNRGEAELTFEQRAPLPFHLLAVIRRFEANG